LIAVDNPAGPPPTIRTSQSSDSLSISLSPPESEAADLDEKVLKLKILFLV
jgi:hypothetical protein